MNLFATSYCPWQSAIDLDDARVVNQCRETAQLVSSAAHLCGIWHEGLYKPTHLHHPVTNWAASGFRPFVWTVLHLDALAEEKLHRFPTAAAHASFTRLKPHLTDLVRLMNPNACDYATPDRFANCAANASLDLNFKHIPDVHLAYREYMKARWALAKRAPRWTNRRRPEW